MESASGRCYMEPIPCKNKEVYSALNSLICEYLEVNGLELALHTFTTECQSKKLPCPNISIAEVRELKAAFTHYDGEKLLKSFDEGDLENFLKLWKQFQTHIQVTSEDMKKLEVYVRVHFAIWPKAHNLTETKQTQAMQQLKMFFEDNSATLSSDASILPLFALPFVSDPRPHPIFKDLFHDSWTTKLRAQLETTVNKYFELLQENITIHCKLASVVVKNSNTGSRSPSLTNSGRFRVRRAPSSKSTGTVTSPNHSVLSSGKNGGSSGDSPGNSGVVEAAMKTAETATIYHQDRFSQLLAIHRKSRKVLRANRENYSKLLKVTSILVSALEKTLKPSDDATLEKILQQCFSIYPEIFMNPSSNQSSTEVTSAGAAPQISPKPDLDHFKKLAAAPSNLSFAPESCDVCLLFLGIPDISLDNLHYDKIKESLASENVSTTDKLCLLQAIRWLITKTSPTHRAQVITHFVENDLFGLTPANQFHADLREAIFSPLLSITPTYQKESVSRLVNAVASTWTGRSYLSSTTYLIETLVHSLSTFKTQEESFICHMVIASLQKLSLRKNMRRLMIENSVIPWVVKYVKSELERDLAREELQQAQSEEEDNATNNEEGNYGDTTFNNYLMEYAWALLMNLCLHPESIKSALTVDVEFLHCIVTMLTNRRASYEYTPYILSTLFSLLRSPELFQKAKTMNLDQKLGPIIPQQPTEIQSHMKHLLTQLYEKENVDRLTASGETDYDDTDNPDPDEVEPELELQESWMNVLNDSVTLTGDDLLIKEYLIPKQFPYTFDAPDAKAVHQTSAATTTSKDMIPTQDSAHVQGSGPGLFLRPTTPTRSKSTRPTPNTNKNAPLYQKRNSSSGPPPSSVLKRREAVRRGISVSVPKKNPLVHPTLSSKNPVVHLIDLQPPSISNSELEILPPPSPPQQFIVGLPPSLQRESNSNVSDPQNSFSLKEAAPLISMMDSNNNSPEDFITNNKYSDTDILVHFEKETE